MLLNGFRIQRAIREWTVKRDTLSALIESAVASAAPAEQFSVLMGKYDQAELAIAQLQVAQARYNLDVGVKLDSSNQEISLSEAVKRIGGLSRSEKLWKSIATNTEAADALKLVAAKSRIASEFRSAISVGNGKEFEIEVDPGLFD